MQYVFLLGRQSLICATEVFRVLTMLGFSPRIIEASSQFLIVEVVAELPEDLMDRLGGTDRIATILGQQPTEWAAKDIVNVLSPTELGGRPTSHKFWLGLSVVQHVPNYNAKQLKRLVQEVKNQLVEKEITMKFVVPAEQSVRLNAAQVIFNKLDTPKNYELLIIQGRDSWYIARTIAIQDIQAYETRDTAKPARDAKVGMLPPKLAQIMINNAVSHLASLPSPLTILDPFCGTGTVLQEGWLMDYQMIGMDNAPAMVAAAQKNCAGVASRFRLNKVLQPRVFEHDVRQPWPPELKGHVDAIVSEPYLGPPLRTPLVRAEIATRHNNVRDLYIAFFRRALSALKPDGVIMCVLPAFRQADTTDLVPFPTAFLDEVEQIGYVASQLVPEELRAWYPGDERQQLIYARPDAFVGRELTLWKKIRH